MELTTNELELCLSALAQLRLEFDIIRRSERSGDIQKINAEKEFESISNLIKKIQGKLC